MPKLLLLPTLLCLSACHAPYISETEARLSLDSTGPIIDSEFVLMTRLTADEAKALDLYEVDWNPNLGAGLYKSSAVQSLTQLSNAIFSSRGIMLDLEHNRPRMLSSTNDPYRSLQWHMDMLEIETAWQTTTGTGITVAVIDSGVSTYGEDTPTNYIAGYDFIDGDYDPTDMNGHGTHVAGTIAQATDNGKGVAGVAPDVSLLAIRAMDENGTGSAYGIASAIVWATDNGADVINMSLGSAYGTSVEEEAINYALARDVVIVAASGNEYTNSVSYPAAYSGVIAVGAVQYDGSVASYSNGGYGLDVVAPGGNTSVDQNGDGYADGVLQETTSGYQFFEGTSMATPHVAGVAALLLSAGAAPDQVEGILTSTAIDLEGSGWSTRSGYGLIDPVSALASIDGSSTEPTVDPDEETLEESTTEDTSADTAAPEISNVSGSRTSSTLTLNWSTDEPATTEIEFEEYGHFGDDPSLVTEHEMRFTIQSNESYVFTIIATDEHGNTGENGQWTTAP